MPTTPPSSPIATRTLEVLGAGTCEDTAIVRSRLDVLGAPYRYLDVDHDPAALARLTTLNGGHRVTPTLTADDVVVAEPTLERVGELLAATGFTGEVPDAVQLHGDITAWPVPYRHRPTDIGVPFHLGSLRGRRQACLFLAHDPGCLACFGYARQLARHHEGLGTADATLVIAPVAAPEALTEWRHGLTAEDVLVADVDGTWHATMAAHLGLQPHGASVVLLDRFLAPRVVASATEAGGLPDPSKMVDWLGFLTLECPECSGELPWPTT